VLSKLLCIIRGEESIYESAECRCRCEEVKWFDVRSFDVPDDAVLS